MITHGHQTETGPEIITTNNVIRRHTDCSTQTVIRIGSKMRFVTLVSNAGNVSRNLPTTSNTNKNLEEARDSDNRNIDNALPRTITATINVLRNSMSLEATNSTTKPPEITNIINRTRDNAAEIVADPSKPTFVSKTTEDFNQTRIALAEASEVKCETKD